MQIKQIFFLGIGGIGMSAIAKYCIQNGIIVGGYDRTSSTITDELKVMGAEIYFEDDNKLLPISWKNPKPDLLIVYTPAIPKNSNLFNFFDNKKFKIMKRSEMLGYLSAGKNGIAVAGTHGKTSISSLITHILKVGGIDCSAFVGGIVKNFKSNYIAGNSDIMVLEADEYDRSFLHLNPQYIILTSIDPDHFDTYKNIKEMELTYQEFMGNLKPNGMIIKKEGLLPCVNGYTYAINSDTADIKINNINLKDTGSNFNYYFDNFIFKNIQFNIPGIHNVENAAVAMSIALLLGIKSEKIRRALSTFQGVEKRMDFVYKSDDFIYIDDYAHHPKELEVLISSLRSIYPQKKLTMVFQPHLYSRTRDLAEGFAQELSTVDELILLELYPAREMPIEGINSEFLLNKIMLKDKHLMNKDELYEFVKTNTPNLLVTAGAGHSDKSVKNIVNIYSSKNEKDYSS